MRQPGEGRGGTGCRPPRLNVPWPPAAGQREGKGEKTGRGVKAAEGGKPGKGRQGWGWRRERETAGHASPLAGSLGAVPGSRAEARRMAELTAWQCQPWEHPRGAVGASPECRRRAQGQRVGQSGQGRQQAGGSAGRAELCPCQEAELALGSAGHAAKLGPCRAFEGTPSLPLTRSSTECIQGTPSEAEQWGGPVAGGSPRGLQPACSGWDMQGAKEPSGLKPPEQGQLCRHSDAVPAAKAQWC